MTKENKQEMAEELNETVEAQQEAAEVEQEVAAEPVEEKSKTQLLQEQVAELTAQLEKEKKEYLFLMAEFDNFRKRSTKVQADLVKNGGEKSLRNLLPVVDDFERAIDAINKNEEANESLREGVSLIYNKFVKYLAQEGVTPIESAQGTAFDTDFHDAITLFPAPSDDLKGKVIDTVQKGYMINDKVLRHAKVVVGQ